MTHWKWIRHEGVRLDNIGVNSDGSLHNPNDYPAETVRAAVAAAEERRKQRRSTAAKKAAETRRIRQEKHVYGIAERLVAGEAFGPRDACIACGRGLGDPESIARGIGSECWQLVLELISRSSAAVTGEAS